jgi:signal transduction histidine kinase
MISSGWHSAVQLGLGLVEILLGIVVIFELRRFGRRLPWLVVLMAFFLVRGADRIYVAFHGSDPDSITTTVDGLLVLVLIFMVVGLRRTVEALEHLDEEARWRQQEYNRALVDFRRLIRHRLANPLTAVTGALETLEARPDIEPELRADLLRAAHEAAERLQDVALGPEIEGAEELELTARPREWKRP